MTAEERKMAELKANLPEGKRTILGLYVTAKEACEQWKAAPEFLEQAARELLEEEWGKRTTSKLPKKAAPLSGTRLG